MPCEVNRDDLLSHNFARFSFLAPFRPRIELKTSWDDEKRVPENPKEHDREKPQRMEALSLWSCVREVTDPVIRFQKRRVFYLEREKKICEINKRHFYVWRESCYEREYYKNEIFFWLRVALWWIKSTLTENE